ncbi:protein of unknown function DUF123 [Halogranum rubrum]|uniref:Uri superfamily endonuclease n=1 Tax=Halogranum rubrum TaxID=553466 RepID=A0A1I4I9L9_9EURY|nr:GIY-YIG nuclease family protein [Halogranum rubrum]SFL50461.1 protein of unknown function DUF123 [Halogranum rubrum]
MSEYGSEPGTYTLVAELPETTRLDVGALGRVELPAGGYAYTGSAFGPGGLSRVERHRRVAAGEHDVRHWHIDSLLGHPSVSITSVVVTRETDIECVVASALESGPVDGFGSSDCTCLSHLSFRPSVEELEADVRDAHRRNR